MEIQRSGNEVYVLLLGIVFLWWSFTYLAYCAKNRKMAKKNKTTVESEALDQLLQDEDFAKQYFLNDSEQKRRRRKPGGERGERDDVQGFTRTPKRDRPIKGQIIDFGPSPYQWNKEENDSFYVTLKPAKGKAYTVWGLGLEKALLDAECGINSQVELIRGKKNDVKVNGNKRDEQGNLVGKEMISAKRQAWTCVAQ